MQERGGDGGVAAAAPRAPRAHSPDRGRTRRPPVRLAPRLGSAGQHEAPVYGCTGGSPRASRAGQRRVWDRVRGHTPTITALLPAPQRRQLRGPNLAGSRYIAMPQRLQRLAISAPKSLGFQEVSRYFRLRYFRCFNGLCEKILSQFLILYVSESSVHNSQVDAVA